LNFILKAFSSVLGFSQPAIRWITDLFFRMESDGQFLSWNVMSSLVGLLALKLE